MYTLTETKRAAGRTAPRPAKPKSTPRPPEPRLRKRGSTRRLPEPRLRPCGAMPKPPKRVGLSPWAITVTAADFSARAGVPAGR